MPTLGEDCHVILSHPEIDAGADYGFVCVLDGSIREGGVQMTREVVTSEPGDPNPTSGTSLFCHFDVLLADELRNPDGSQHITTRSADYAKLVQFLGKQSGITLTMPLGAVVNLGALGWTADERHTPLHSIVKCQLNNVGHYFPPVDPLVLKQSVWGYPELDPQPVGYPAVPGLTWDGGFWR